jgi:hypothetical protein
VEQVLGKLNDLFQTVFFEIIQKSKNARDKVYYASLATLNGWDQTTANREKPGEVQSWSF